VTGCYILVGQTPVPEPDPLAWAEWFEQIEHRRVRLTRVGPFEVSTIFLGFDHNSWGNGHPILFETMASMPEMLHPVRLGRRARLMREWTDVQERCSTWTQAEAQHDRVVEELREPWDEVVQLWPEPLPACAIISNDAS